jgi:hypothetical protein
VPAKLPDDLRMHRLAISDLVYFVEH